MRSFLKSLVLLVVLVFGTGAHGEERVLDFNSDITVNEDGSLDVIETIRVNAEGSVIRRGIFRDIPMRQVTQTGLWDKNGFTIRSIKHNGSKAKYQTEWNGNFIRIYIGDADVFIPHGEHTYEITYSTTGQLRFFDSYDELYWNVTGNFWTLWIMKASATVRLPQGAVVTKEAGYTGEFGATGPGKYSSSGFGTREISFETLGPLAPENGFTLAAGFTKGVVAQGASSGFLTNLLANAGALVFGLGLAFVPIYYLIAWWRVGRDPPGETIIPLFHPPENLSPSAMSFVHFKSFRQAGRGASLSFIAALLALGVRKLLVIDEDEKGNVTFRRGEAQDVPLNSLPAAERTLYANLLQGYEKITLDKANGPLLMRAHQALQSSIRTEYAGKFYKHNWGLLAVGPIVGLLAIIVGLILQDPPEAGVLALVPTFISSLAGFGLAFFGWRNWSSPSQSTLLQVLGGLMMLGGMAIIAATAWGINASGVWPLFQIGAYLVMIAMASFAAMAHLLGAPTLNGAKVLSRIEGFKLYLTTAETERLNMRDAPQMNEELFERYLPYAAGLGVEEPWSNAFSAHLARVAPDQVRDRNYHPGWYRGRDFDLGSLARATGASVAAVSAAMASSMPAPKSSSGSGGGGFSGGGGGGGGGGGW